uniref:Uncharacterized protein n=1 Tax=Lepeophtheirus salmonis TaxID=72036 RepID=A0A0K2SYM5_LEPSM
MKREQVLMTVSYDRFRSCLRILDISWDFLLQEDLLIFSSSTPYT